jgi:hypothetical protein
MQPSAFWSSFAYVLTAFFIYYRAPSKTFELKLWSGVLCYLAFSSMFAHASYLRLALAMDFVIISFFSFTNLLKLLKRSHKEIIFWFVIFSSLLVVCFYFISGLPRILLSVLIFFFALGDLFRDMKSELWQGRSKPFWICMGVLFVSFWVFIIDTFQIFCLSNSIFHGHTLWHIGSAISTYFYGVWRFQLPSISSKKAS